MIKKLLHFFKTSRWFLIALIVWIVTVGVIIFKLNAPLKNEVTTNGIITFEFIGLEADAHQALVAWKQHGVIDAAVRSYYIDTFLFALTLGLLLFVMLVKWGFHRRVSSYHRALWLPLFVIFFDEVENVIAILFITGKIEWTFLLPIVTTLKFTLGVIAAFNIRPVFVMVLFWLGKFSTYLKTLLETTWTFRVIVLTMFIIYFALWHSDQGQDLLINLNSSKAGVLFFYVIITLIALLNWHLPKYLSYCTSLPIPRRLIDWLNVIFNGTVKYKSVSKRKIMYVEDSDLARALGIITFLIPAFGMLNVLEKYGIQTYHPHVWLVCVSIIAFYILRHNYIDNAFIKYPKYRWVFYSVITICLLAIVLLFALNDRKPGELIFASIGLCILAFLFLICTSIRSFLPSPIAKIKIAGWVMWPNVILALLFIVLNFMPLSMAEVKTGIASDSIKYSTISILLYGLVAYMIFFSILIFWSRTTRINIIAFLFIGCFIMAIFINNKFHNVPITKPTVAKTGLHTYVKQWIASRKGEIDLYSDSLHTPYPIVIVNAYGGGIRAAAWTSLMISNLDDMVSKNKRGVGDSFQRHVFAYSGASGGTIGISIMCALMRQDSSRHVKMNDLINFYSSDFLSPVVIGLIGRDPFFSTFGVNGKDRARLQEELWAHHLDSHFDNDVYGKNLSMVWPKNQYSVPLLFSNSTQVERGIKGVVTAVAIDPKDFPSAITNHDLVSNDIKLSTAAFLSARFPFISPAARINSQNHFLDGGIYENSGGETAAEIAQVFKNILNSDDYKTLSPKVKIIMVSLSNSPPNAEENKDKNLFELSAPLNALISNVDGSAYHADRKNEEDFRGKYYRFYPKRIEPTDTTMTAVLPLGWQLSGEALLRLKNSISHPDDTVASRLKKLLHEFERH